MKRIIIFLSLLSLSFNGFSQIIDEAGKRKITTGFDLFTDIWMDKPAGMKTSAINRGFNMFFLYNIPFGETNLTFSPGIGLGIHNVYSNFLLVTDTTGISDFVPFKTLYPDLDYKKNKLTVTYFDIPFEFIYKTRCNLRFSAGFKVGFLLQSHTKYRGDDYLNGNTDELKVKFFRLKNIDDYRYGVTARIGWKWINAYGYYSLSKLFTKNWGPEMYPVSVGISIIPFYPEPYKKKQ
jgi:hypothetical protein